MSQCEGEIFTRPMDVSAPEFLAIQELRRTSRSSPPPVHQVSREDGIYHCNCDNDPFHSQMAFHHHHTHVPRASYPEGSGMMTEKRVASTGEAREKMALRETMEEGRLRMGQADDERIRAMLEQERKEGWEDDEARSVMLAEQRTEAQGRMESEKGGTGASMGT